MGNAGSGAFANCELFFSHMGVWDKIERNAMGYNDAAAAFGNNQLDAFWLFTAFPSGAVIMAAQTNDIALLPLAKDAEMSGFFKKYPYFGKLAVPAGTPLREVVRLSGVADIFTEVLGREITYSSPSLLRFARRMRKRGYPWMYVVVTSALYLSTRRGSAERITDSVKRLLGRDPIQMRHYVEDYADVWRK